MQTNKINSTPSNVFEHIKNDIETGVLKPGDKLPSERELVKTLGVSRSSIREAIKFLTVLGYVETIKRKGTFISRKYMDTPSISSPMKSILEVAPIHDLMEVRIFLEENFIALAIERATNINLAKMSMALDRMKRSSNRLVDFFKADLDFHFALAEATNNVVIIELMKIIIRRIKENKDQFIASSSQTKETTINAFERIIFDIANKNVTEATALYRNHIYMVDDVLKRITV